MNRVELAALNNAEWCNVVCGGTFDERLWWSAQRSPQFYPDAVTLVPGVSAAEILARVDGGEGCSVKDSFFDLELPGFDVLFEAEWFWLEDAGDAPGWRRSAGEGNVAYLTDGVSSAIANRSEHVIGISNVEGDHRAAAAAAQSVFGRLPVVGYEREPRFEPIGRLRVLVRPRTA